MVHLKAPDSSLVCKRHNTTETIALSTHRTLLTHTKKIHTYTMASHGDPSASTFPTNPEEFDSDERISFSKLDNKFLLVQPDGTEYEFDDAIKRWIPIIDEALAEEQQKAYRVEGVDESEPVEAMKKKRKKEYVNGEDVSPYPRS